MKFRLKPLIIEARRQGNEWILNHGGQEITMSHQSFKDMYTPLSDEALRELNKPVDDIQGKF